MWVPCGEYFYTNQAPVVNQTIAQFAERRSKYRTRPKPYERPEGPNRVPTSRIPHVQVEGAMSVPEDGRRRNMDIDPNRVQIRAEERRDERQQHRQKQVNLLSLSPPPPPHPPPTATDASSSVGVPKPSSNSNSKNKKKNRHSNKNARWLAFKERKKAAKNAAQIALPPPRAPPPPLSSSSSSVPTPDVARKSASEQLNAPLPPLGSPSPQAKPGDTDLASDEVTNLLHGVFSTANGSSITFDGIKPLDLDEIDIDELLPFEEI